MKKLMVLAMCVAITGCAWFKANEAALTAAQLQAVNCITSQALAGQPVEVIAITCAIQDITSVVKVLDSTHTPVVPSAGLSLARQQMATHK